jgi:hypothetical protein
MKTLLVFVLLLTSIFSINTSSADSTQESLQEELVRNHLEYLSQAKQRKLIAALENQKNAQTKHQEILAQKFFEVELEIIVKRTSAETNSTAIAFKHRAEEHIRNLGLDVSTPAGSFTAASFLMAETHYFVNLVIIDIMPSNGDPRAWLEYYEQLANLYLESANQLEVLESLLLKR